MSDTVTKKVLLNVEISSTEAIKRIADFKAQVDGLKTKQKELDTTTEQGRQQYEIYGQQIKAVTTASQTYQKEIQNAVKAQNAEKDSIQQLKANLSNLTAEYNKLSKEQRNAPDGQKKAQDIKAMSDSLKKLEGDLGNNRRSVGDYGKAIQNLGGWMKGLALGAVAAGVAFLTSAFKGSIDAALEAEKSMQRLSFAIKTVGGGTDSDVEKLAKQAKDLMGIFSHEEIETAATKMLNFGLTVSQVSKLMPLMVDASAQSGKSLEEMAGAIDKGVTSGSIIRGALGQLGVVFKDTGDKAENYRLVV